jgi:O-antigen ligase
MLPIMLPNTLTSTVKQFTGGILDLLFRARKLIFALIGMGMGYLIGSSAIGSRELHELVLSVCIIGLFMLIAFQYPFAAFLSWLFLNTFIDSWVEIPLGKGIPDLSFGRLAVGLLFTSLLMRVSTRRLGLVPLSSTDFFAFLVPLGIALAAPLSVSPITTVQTAISFYLMPLAAFLLAKQLIRKEVHLDWCLGIIALFGTFAGAYALYETLTGNVLFLAKGAEVGRVLRGDTGVRLIVGLVGETGAMGRLLATTLFVTIYIIMEDKNAYFKPLWLMGALLQFGGLLATFSRTPLLAFILGLFILQFSYPALRKVLVVLVLVVAATVGMNWQQIQRTQVAQDRLSGLDSANGRTMRWEAGIRMWEARPIRGWGFGQYELMSGRFRTDGRRANIHAVENDFLNILVSTGLIGFAPYLLFLLTGFWSSLRLFFRRKQLAVDGFIRPGTLALYWAIFACFMLGSFTAVNAQVVSRLIPFALIGAIIGTHQPMLARRLGNQFPTARTAVQTTAHTTARTTVAPLPAQQP